MKQTTEYMEYPKGNREHKSSLFCKVFGEKKHLLDLYNSVNGTNYQNEDDLEVNTFHKKHNTDVISRRVLRASVFFL